MNQLHRVASHSRDWPAGVTLDHGPRQSALDLSKKGLSALGPYRRPVSSRTGGGAGAGHLLRSAREGSAGRQGPRAHPLPAVGSFRHEPGPGDADEAPERGEDDDREGKGVRGHGGARDAQTWEKDYRQMLRDARVLAGQWAASMRITTGPPGERAPPAGSAQAQALESSGVEGQGRGAGARG